MWGDSISKHFRDAERQENYMATLEREKSVVTDSGTNETRTGKAPNRDEIAELAYFIWEHNGRIEGNSEQDWLQAEREFGES
jgi:hypothetical protein